MSFWRRRKRLKSSNNKPKANLPLNKQNTSARRCELFWLMSLTRYLLRSKLSYTTFLTGRAIKTLACWSLPSLTRWISQSGCRARLALESATIVWSTNHTIYIKSKQECARWRGWTWFRCLVTPESLAARQDSGPCFDLFSCSSFCTLGVAPRSQQQIS